MKVLTESELRSKYRNSFPKEIVVSPATVVTPAALQLLRDRGSILVKKLETVAQDEDQGSTSYKSVGKVKIAVSGRHVHLSLKDAEQLFGKGYKLTKKQELTQLGEFAAEETVILAGPKGINISGVRVLGPYRSQTQVEISRTDAYRLGVIPPSRDSGDLGDTPGILLVGPVGSVELPEGLIAALRHIHMSPAEAASFGVRDRDKVQVKVTGPRSLVFDKVLVRVKNDYRLEMHLDTDEANAAALVTGEDGTIWVPGDE